MMLGSINCQSASPASASVRNFGFGEFKDGGFFKQMAVEMADFVFAKRAAFGHDREKFFQRFGKHVSGRQCRSWQFR